MKKSHWFFGILLFLVFPLSADVKNVDKPSRGEWDFKLAKEWEIDKAGTDVLGKPYRLLVSDEGDLYVYDEANRCNYLFDKDGNFIKAFGRKGQGPGEVRMQRSSFLVGDKHVIVDEGRIHYFKLDGTYIRSERNSSYRRRPVLFLNEHEFVAFPLGIFETSDFKAQITRFNLKTGQETVITNFSIYQGGVGRAGRMVASLNVIGLTPMMTVGYGNDCLYYGMSDSYKIHVTDLDGKLLNTFTINRKKRNIEDKEKKKYFEKYSRINRQALAQIIKTTPNESTHFSRIEIHRRLVYVFVPDIFRHHHQPIDIFTPDGIYLYRGVLNIDDNLAMMEPQLFNPLIKEDSLYVSVMDENDEIRIIKYKISLPSFDQ